MNSGGTDVSKVFVDSMSTISKHYVSKAGYDKTIQAQILSCVDETIGLYRCRYQDSVWDAFSNNIDITYPNGSYVYVLIPGNDFRNAKTILGSTKKLGINYISQVEGDSAYDIIGTNCVISSPTYCLDSFNQSYSYIIYKADQTSDFQLDVEALNKYIKKSSSLIIEAVFKTSIPTDRQYNGHYGIIYNLKFKDNATGGEVIRSYILDEDSMIDNPYRLIDGTRQYEIFEIDGDNFVRVESIEIFNRDFPGATGEAEGKLSAGDIEISKIGLTGAVKFSSNDLDGVKVSLLTPQGSFFKETALLSDVLTIIAEVRIKGKVASSAQDISFYWGRQDMRISAENKYYNKYLGRGWYCLNTQNIISEQEGIVEWVPAENTFIIRCEEAIAKHNKIKVAILYNGQVFTEQIDIENESASVSDITIDTDNGILKYFNDIGHPNLICKIDGQEDVSQNYIYSWAYVSNTGQFISLPETEEEYTDYINALTQLNQITQAIASGTSFPNANKENLRIYEEAVDAFDSVQMVKGNRVYNAQIRNITSFGTFKCSVYDRTRNEICIGTGTITLTNEIGNTDLYTLIINNGSAVFQYNEEGVAPNSKKLTSPQTLQGLSFTIYDKQGYAIDQELIKSANNCKIRWIVPIEDTMLEDQQEENGGRDGTDPTLRYAYYEDITNLSYGIAQSYNVNKQNNQIQLEVNYKGNNLIARTNFSFIKQGDPGTNGTEYVVKLIPNTAMSNPPQFPVITKVGIENSSYYINYGINTTNDITTINLKGSAVDSYQLFKAQLWYGGDLIWEGFDADTVSQLDGVTKPTLVSWSVLQNTYGKNSLGEIIQDESDFEITVENAPYGRISYKGNNLDNDNTFSSPKANIIKCRIVWDGKTYFGTIPITTAWIKSTNYQIGLKDNTGFRYVAYTSDGVLPSYDSSNPFEFICQERINDVWEDVSCIEGSHAIEYTFDYCGNVVTNINGQNVTYTNSNLLKAAYRLTSQQANLWSYRPVVRYDGECVNVAVLCTYEQNESVIGRINAPIHFYLNKFGLDHLNDWDGNSIQVNEEDGYILAPQVGAGSKDENNRFTGVLMGEIKNPSKNNTSNTGLFGYSDGDRTFFLNSENGSALLGKSGAGQIIIDPSNNNKALIYSGNFWSNSNFDSTTGLPINYTYRNNNYVHDPSNTTGDGMIINLSLPEIYFGSGKFYVTNEGILHATGANVSGDITANNLYLGAGSSIPQQYQNQNLAQLISNLESLIPQGIDGKIGGRNIIRDTKHYTNWVMSAGVTTTSNEPTDILNFPASESILGARPAVALPYSIIRDKKVIFTAYAKATASQTECQLRLEFDLLAGQSGSRQIYTNRPIRFTPNGQWQEIQYIYEISDSIFTVGSGTVNFDDCWFRPLIYVITNMAVDIKQIKLEIGTIATDWTPAPEDVEGLVGDQVETWAQSIDPSKMTGNIWGESGSDAKADHEGDLWYYTGTTKMTNGYSHLTNGIQPSKTYQYKKYNNDYRWELYGNDNNQTLFDFADGKATITFGDINNPPLNPNEHDLLIDNTSENIYIYDGSQWQEIKNYNAALNMAINNLNDQLSAQIDGKIETFAQPTDPSLITGWQDSTHEGDLWYYTGTTILTGNKYPSGYSGTQEYKNGIRPSRTYQYQKNGNNYKWELYEDSNVENIFDFFDGKATIYYENQLNEPDTQSLNPYPGVKENDLLICKDGSTYKYIKSGNTYSWVSLLTLDSLVQAAVDELEETIPHLDDQVLTFAQRGDPSSNDWDVNHNGDLWYYTGTTEIAQSTKYPNGIKPSRTYYFNYNATTNVATWNLLEADDLNNKFLFDLIDEKATIYYTNTSNDWPAAQDGDYLFNRNTKEIYRYDSQAGNTDKDRWVPILDLANRYAAVVSKNGVVTVQGGEYEPLSFTMWMQNQTYKENDCVYYNGQAYICILNHTATGITPLNTTYWQPYDESIFILAANGKLIGTDVAVTGTIYATAGLIGGWNIAENWLWNGVQGAKNSIYLTPQGTTSAVNIKYQSKRDWAITAGDSFGVSKDGQLYASSGHIGNLQITNDRTNNWNVNYDYYAGTVVVYNGDLYRATQYIQSGGLTPDDKNSLWSNTEQDGTTDISVFEGYIGYKSGMTQYSDGTAFTTNGVALGVDNNYFIATESGARMTSGQGSADWAPSIFVTPTAATMRKGPTRRVSISDSAVELLHGTKISLKQGSSSNIRSVEIDGTGVTLTGYTSSYIQINNSGVNITKGNTTYELTTRLSNIESTLDTKITNPAGGQIGFVLAVASNSFATWTNPANLNTLNGKLLPSTTGATENQVLTLSNINNTLTPVWATAQGGGSGSETTYTYLDNSGTPASTHLGVGVISTGNIGLTSNGITWYTQKGGYSVSVIEGGVGANQWNLSESGATFSGNATSQFIFNQGSLRGRKDENNQESWETTCSITALTGDAIFHNLTVTGTTTGLTATAVFG